MWFTRVSIQNPVFATMMMVALMVLGLFSYKRLSVEEFPEVKFPIVVVTTSYPGAAPEIVESEISRKMEESLNAISGLKNVFSYSYEGQSVVVAEHIREAVYSKELVKRSTGENLGRITISIGVAEWRRGDTAQSIVERADVCLYAAKRGGRNMVKSETDEGVFAGHKVA